MVRVSKHASQRLKERCGLKKKSVRRMAANMDANNIRIYGNYIYIFCGETLVTVLHVPHRLKNHVNEQQKRLNRKQEELG